MPPSRCRCADSASFRIGGERVPALEDVSFDLRSGEVLALVGESGSGKLLTALTVMGLLPEATGVDRGTVLLEHRHLVGLPAQEMTRLRGDRMSMIFQEPMTSLNPVLTIGRQLTERLEFHLGLTPQAAAVRAGELLRLVGIAAAERRLREYVFISHDIAVVAYLSHRIAVMYLGAIVESSPARDILRNPQHPYTELLLAAVPAPHPRLRRRAVRRPAGGVAAPHGVPRGCRFAARCPIAVPRCRTEPPELRELSSGHFAACHLR